MSQNGIAHGGSDSDPKARIMAVYLSLLLARPANRTTFFHTARLRLRNSYRT